MRIKLKYILFPFGRLYRKFNWIVCFSFKLSESRLATSRPQLSESTTYFSWLVLARFFSSKKYDTITRKGIIFLLTLVFSCTPENHNDLIEHQISSKKAEQPNSKMVSAKENDIYSKLDSFVFRLHGNNFSRVELFPQQQQFTEYLNFFSKTNLTKAIGYRHYKFASFKELKYADFDIIILEYESDSIGLLMFQELKSKAASIISRAALESMNGDKKYDTIEGVDPKNGSFIINRNNLIISLAERCAGNNLNLQWWDYEIEFLKTIFDEKTEYVDGITSNCGDAVFKIEHISFL